MRENSNITKREEAAMEASRQVPSVAMVVDIFENEDEILLHADMPGVTKENSRVRLENGRLEISGLRTLKTSGSASREEFGNVEYQRIFSVPQTIDIEKVNAELKDGVLRLHLPKSEAARPKEIEIH